MYSKDFTDDGYSEILETTGGEGGIQVTIANGSGTVTLLYCPPDENPLLAANYAVYDADGNATLSASGVVGVKFLEGYYVLQLSSSSTPEIKGSFLGRGVAFRNLKNTPA